MIMISSKAGQRLAKALANLNDLDSKAESDVASGKSRLYVAGRLAEAQYEFQQAAKALGEELIADKHHLVEGGLIMILFVPYIASSTNVALRANKHANNREVKAAAWACKAACQGITPVGVQVDLVFRPRLGKGERMRDTSNYSISMKHIEDGLVAAGLIPDDRGQYVRRVILDPPEVDRKAESGTWVEIIPVSEVAA